MERRDVQLFLHISDYCNDIEKYLAAIDRRHDVFLENTMSQHSISFCILQIGELVGRISEELRSNTTREINWIAIRGMRNIVAHDYGNVDIEEIWNVAVNDIPILKDFCERMLKKD